MCMSPLTGCLINKYIAIHTYTNIHNNWKVGYKKRNILGTKNVTDSHTQNLKTENKPCQLGSIYIPINAVQYSTITYSTMQYNTAH